MQVFTRTKDGRIKSPKGTVVTMESMQDQIDEGRIVLQDAPKVDPSDAKAKCERLWRDAELRSIDFDINKIEDSGQAATKQRAYRSALRDYPQQPDFPNGSRPALK